MRVSRSSATGSYFWVPARRPSTQRAAGDPGPERMSRESVCQVPVSGLPTILKMMAISSTFDTLRLRDLVGYFCARANVALTTPPRCPVAAASVLGWAGHLLLPSTCSSQRSKPCAPRSSSDRRGPGQSSNPVVCRRPGPLALGKVRLTDRRAGWCCLSCR